MTVDRDLQSLLTDWMREDAILPDDVYEVIDQLPQTPQRRHRWSFTIPALTWRNNDMYNATRAVIAVLVLALGPGLIMATVSDDDSERANLQQTEARSVDEMARFTYTSVLSADYPDGSEVATDYGMARRGGRVEYTIEASDDRVDGSSVHTYNLDYYDSDELAYPVSVITGTQVVTNGGGTWEGTFELLDFPGTRDEHHVAVLTGSGDYEGLTAVLYGMDGTNEGVIFPGALPEMP